IRQYCLSQCPVGYGRRNRMKTPGEMLGWQKKHAVSLKTAVNMSQEELQGKIVIGEFADKNLPELTDSYRRMIREVQKRPGEEE
ncbi:MAG: 2-oxoacid:ferredoxin oxidoreductase subunit beta, partial [Firmicutes bacterium]|nr:2-oxoacid:ferredoxin oxidoreductase subunit beta [Bacillota bacterium]